MRSCCPRPVSACGRGGGGGNHRLPGWGQAGGAWRLSGELASTTSLLIAFRPKYLPTQGQVPSMSHPPTLPPKCPRPVTCGFPLGCPGPSTTPAPRSSTAGTPWATACPLGSLPPVTRTRPHPQGGRAQAGRHGEDAHRRRGQRVQLHGRTARKALPHVHLGQLGQAPAWHGLTSQQARLRRAACRASAAAGRSAWAALPHSARDPQGRPARWAAPGPPWGARWHRPWAERAAVLPRLGRSALRQELPLLQGARSCPPLAPGQAAACASLTGGLLRGPAPPLPAAGERMDAASP